MVQDKYLPRSHVQSSLTPLAVAYLILAAIVSSIVVGVSLIDEPTMETVNGLPFLGLGHIAKADASQWEEQPRQGFIGWVRLLPVPDQPELEDRVPSEVYSLGLEDQHGSAVPAIYYRIFSEIDLMSRLEMGTIYYTIY